MNAKAKQLLTIILLSACLGYGAILASKKLEGGPKGDFIKEPRNAFAARALELYQAVEKSPDDLKLRTLLAETLVAQGFAAPSAEIVIKGLEQYKKVLKVDKKNKDALLSLARASMDLGVRDTAKIYYKKYLSFYPEDEKAQIDLALIEFASGDKDKGFTMVDEVIKVHPELFSSHMAKLLMHMENKDEQKIIDKQFAAAANVAKSADEIKQLEEVKLLLGSNAATPLIASTAEKLSLEDRLVGFVKNHPILGGKLESYKFQKPCLLEVSLANFPLNAMPEMAKKSLEAKFKALFEDGAACEVKITTSTGDSWVIK